MDSGLIRQDVEAFQVAVKKLSGEVGSAGSLWSDTKFSELFSAVSMIANMSRDIMVAGDNCCNTIDRFAMLSAEEY